MELVYSTHKNDFLYVFEEAKTKKAWNELVDKLLNQYMPLICKIASFNKSLPFEIAKSAAIDGFYVGIKIYADKKMYLGQIHLASHLGLYIRSECQKERRSERNIHIPHNHLVEYEKATRKGIFEKENLTEEEKQIKDTLERDIGLVMNQASLDTKVNPHDDMTIGDIIPDDSKSVVMDMMDMERFRLLERNIANLPAEQRFCLIHHKGLFGEEEKGYKEIGELIGVSYQTVSNYINKAINSMTIAILENERLDAYDLR